MGMGARLIPYYFDVHNSLTHADRRVLVAAMDKKIWQDIGRSFKKDLKTRESAYEKQLDVAIWDDSYRPVAHIEPLQVGDEFLDWSEANGVTFWRPVPNEAFQMNQQMESASKLIRRKK